MHPNGAASAAWVFASAPTKIPFYLAGGLLVCWAVLLAAIGITHPGFPGSAGRARLVMLTSVVLVAATLTSAVATGGGASEGGMAGEGAARPAGAAGPSSRTLQLTADPTGQLAYDKDQAAVKAGKLSIRLTNASSVPHNVTIAMGTRTVAATRTIQRATTTLTANVPPGDYVFFCSVEGHRQAGMDGTLTAE